MNKIRMFKIQLLPENPEESEEKETYIESEIIFENGTQLYFSDRETIILSSRSFTINANMKGIEYVTYFYEKV